MGRRKRFNDLIVIDINVTSNDKIEEILKVVKEALKDFPEVDLESIDSVDSSWFVDGG